MKNHESSYKHLHNRNYLKRYRKNLRNEGTKAEAFLWIRIKNRQMGGYRFRRQHSVGNYILDFYCHQKRLAIELDGYHHYTIAGQIQDAERDTWLAENGIKVLRFENKRVFEELDQVLEEIQFELNR